MQHIACNCFKFYVCFYRLLGPNKSNCSTNWNLFLYSQTAFNVAVHPLASRVKNGNLRVCCM